MNPRAVLFLKLVGLAVLILLLVLLFPPLFQFVEEAAGELRFFWWLILLVGLAVWLIWGLGKKKK
jgi:uncharacterized protein with PQ loop repeat